MSGESLINDSQSEESRSVALKPGEPERGEPESSGSELSGCRTVYVSAVDWWLAFLLLAGPAICVASTAVLLTRGQSHEALVCLVVGALTLIATALFTIPCRYTLLSDCLTIRCGVYFTRIPLEQIQAVERSGSWLSGPALSLRRVKISTASRIYLVSPVDRDRFIDDLSKAAQTVRQR